MPGRDCQIVEQKNSFTQNLFTHEADRRSFKWLVIMSTRAELLNCSSNLSTCKIPLLSWVPIATRFCWHQCGCHHSLFVVLCTIRLVECQKCLVAWSGYQNYGTLFMDETTTAKKLMQSCQQDIFLSYPTYFLSFRVVVTFFSSLISTLPKFSPYSTRIFPASFCFLEKTVSLECLTASGFKVFLDTTRTDGARWARSTS